MGKSGKELSVAALERMLQERKSLLESLSRQRKKLRKDLDRVEQKIVSLQGRGGSAIGSVRRKRPKNARPLAEVVTDILGRSKSGYPLAKLSEKVLASGYKSGSSDFKNVLYQCLYNSPDVVHEPESGNYKLKK